MSRVMIVEPLPLMRQAIAQVVQRLGHEVVAEVENGQEALVHARSDGPELVVLELAIEGLGGLDLIRRLKLRDPALQLLVYTGQSSSHFSRLCVQAGADGFVNKHDEPPELERGLQAVVHGRQYFPRESRRAPTPVGGKELDTLSARELTVLELISEGRSNQAIAEQLSISYKTVSTYKTRLQEKLQVDSRMALATIAQRNGIGSSGVATLAESESKAEHEHDPTQQALMRAMLEASPNPMFVRDREGRLMLCNQPFLAWHHASLERVQGGRLTDAFWFTAEEGQRYQARYDELLEKGEAFTNQITLVFLGEPHFMQFWVEPWRDAEGNVQGMVGSFEDLTDRQTLLGQLRDAHEQAQARYREVTGFAHVVHDDLLEPLQRLQASLAPVKVPLPAQSALRIVTQRLAQLQHLLTLDQQRPPLVPSQLDITQWLEVRLAAFSAQLTKGFVAPILEMKEVTARQLWIDGERLGTLFDCLLEYLSEAAPMAPLRINLATRLQVNGAVSLNLAIILCRPLEHRRGIALQLCRNLTQSMEGSFRVVHENGETAFLIGLESAAAL